MDAANQVLVPAYQFAKDSYRLVKKCTKPDRKGITKINCSSHCNRIF